MENYLVVLFKNKLKKRIIKKFVRLDRAIVFFNKMAKDSEEVIFETRVTNGESSDYEIGLIELNSRSNSPTYFIDEFGRNTRVKLEEDNMNLKFIKPFRKEEKIFDLKQSKKINVQSFIKTYLSGPSVKMISTINNKVVVQKDEDVFIFSLKNDEESKRFLSCVSNYFFKIKRTDCIFIKDFSTPQKKYIFQLLNEKGIDKKILYRKFTTYRPLTK